MSSILENPAVRQAALPITVEQYHRLGAAGIIAENTELLRGVILEKMIKSPDHTWIVQFLVEWLRTNLHGDVHIRQEQPLTFEDSEPEPDVAVVSGTPGDYRQAHPAQAILVIEVAVSSVDLDRQKAELYSAAGVTEYLIVSPVQECVEVHTEPSPTGYGRHQQYGSGATVQLQSFPQLSLEVSHLFGSA